MTGLRTSAIGAALRRRVERIRAGGEEGWVLVVAMTVMTIMIGFGMAILAVADTQSRAGGTERQRDSSFSLADAGLNSMMYSLSNSWPGKFSTSFPTCTQASTDPRCPTKSYIQSLINSPDTASNLQWQFNVYDNGVNAQGQSLQSFYADAYTSGQPANDANGDGKVWVRAQVTVGSITKTVVALVQSQYSTVGLPHAVILTGALQTTDQGNKVIIDTAGNPPASTPGAVDVRCNPLLDSNCLVYNQSKNQISPDTTSANYSGATSFFTQAVKQSLIQQAQASGTYYSTCPASLPTAAAVIWIDSGNCSYTGNQTINSPSAPGLLVINNGSLSLAGTLTFYGLVYGLNAQGWNDTNPPVISLGGNAQIIGAVFIDGNGLLAGGSSKLNVQFDEKALSTVQTLSNVSPIQSTWRQL